MVSKKQELVLLDERFIRWLGSPDVEDKDIVGRFLIIVETEDDEISIHSYDKIDEIKEHVKGTEEEDSGWHVEAIFDTKDKKEINFDVTTKVNIDFP